MTEAQAIELVAEQVANNWTAATGLDRDTQLILENDAIPTDGIFGALTMKHTVSRLLSIGTVRRWERRGWIFVKLWTPANAGRKGFSTMADGVRGILEGEQLGAVGDAITVFGGQTDEVGIDGKWYIGAVKFPFQYVESR